MGGGGGGGPQICNIARYFLSGFVNSKHSSRNVKGAVRRKSFDTISILVKSTFHMRKYSVLTKSISHHVPEIFMFL